MERAAGELDWANRHQQLTATWAKDSFLRSSVTGKPRKAANFHSLYAAQHASAAREGVAAKKRCEDNQPPGRVHTCIHG